MIVTAFVTYILKLTDEISLNEQHLNWVNTFTLWTVFHFSYKMAFKSINILMLLNHLFQFDFKFQEPC